MRSLAGRWATLMSAGTLLLMANGCVAAQVHRERSVAAAQEAENLSRWPDRYPLAAEQELGIVEVSRTSTSSLHLVQIRHRESLHTHREHDLVAVLLKGRGTLRLGSQTVAMQKGSVIAIPRGVPHAFVNESREPAAVFAVFSPPLDGPDTVAVLEEPHPQ